MFKKINNAMARLLAVTMVLLILFSGTSKASFASDARDTQAPQSNLIINLIIGNPNMTINGIDSEIDVNRNTVPILINNRSFLPIRSIIESIGGKVNWDGSDRKVTLTLNNKTIQLWVNNPKMTIDGVEKEIDLGRGTVPIIVNSRTLLPIRAIIEEFGGYIEWNTVTKSVTITYPNINASANTNTRVNTKVNTKSYVSADTDASARTSTNAKTNTGIDIDTNDVENIDINTEEYIDIKKRDEGYDRYERDETDERDERDKDVNIDNTGRIPVLVPAYFYDQNIWDRLYEVLEDGDTVVINPNNGVGSSVDSHFQKIVSKCNTLGINVVGYVATTYGKKDLSAVKSEVDKWNTMYGVKNIFFDEVTNTSNGISYYQDLYDYVRGTTILNPGTSTIEGYMDCSDIIMDYESSYDSYISASFPSWRNKYDADRFCHLIYEASQAESANASILAKERNVGWVYFTDDKYSPNPWDSLASYQGK